LGGGRWGRKSTGRVHRLKKLSGPVFPSVV